MSPEIIKPLVLLLFAFLVIIAALKDLASFTIPNWISIALALAFAPAALLAGVPLPAIGLSFAIATGVLVLGMVMFALGWVGGGDAKLMTAAALWLGPRAAAFDPVPLVSFFAYTGVAGGVLAVSLVALRSSWIRPMAEAGPAWAKRLATPGEAAPYGVAIAAGALLAFGLHPIV